MDCENKAYEISALIAIAEKDYEGYKDKDLSESRAWDICHNEYYKVIKEGTEPNIDHLALHLAMYLANWGMYRGSSFIRNYNYREFIEVVEILLGNDYRTLFDIEFEEYRKDNKKIDLLIDLENKLKEYLGSLRSTVKGKVESNISQTLTTKILLATLGCIPAYDTYFTAGLKRNKIASATFGKRSISELAEFYNDNKNELNECRNGLINPENEKLTYPQAKLLDMIFFGLGNKQEKDSN